MVKQLPKKDFKDILKLEEGPSYFDNVQGLDNNLEAIGSFDNQLTPYHDNRSEGSTGKNRESWISSKNLRGRSSALDDNRSEREKMQDRQNSRKRNMLENSHHLHLSSSRKSITMQGQSSITHSITREKEPSTTHVDS